MEPNQISVTEYLSSKGIAYREAGSEIVTKCLFNGCDEDSRPNEQHLYLSKETGQFDCKKCGEKGNLATLAKHLGDEVRNLYRSQNPPFSTKKKEAKKPIEEVTKELVERCHQALPHNIRTYLNARGIPNDLIDQFKLGWGEFYGENWIVIPVPKKDCPGEYALLKLRRDPEAKESEKGPKMKVWPVGATHELFDWNMLKGATHLVLCEGEFDCMVLLSKGIPAVTSTGGCGTFKQEWLKEFSNLESVCVCYDNDTEGEKGAIRVLDALKSIETLKLFQTRLPLDMGEGLKDVTDYFTKYGGDPQAFMELAQAVSRFDAKTRIKRIEKVEKAVSFAEWQETVTQQFPDCAFAAETGLAVISQLLIKDITNPFALVLVDVPSSGKTITTNFFDGLEGLTYASDKFTPASFVSNASNVKREKLAEIDLLPRLRYHMFLVRDLATLFSKREDDLQECLGILTRVLDGEGFKTDSGIHGERAYIGEYLFMMLAASTPISSRVWRIMGSLGSRLFFLNMNARNKSEHELADQLVSTAVKDKERACRIITKHFLFGLWHRHQEGIEWNRQGDPRHCLLVITRCAKLLANLRGIVSLWKVNKREGEEDEYDYQPPVIEKPDRIAQLFYNLCRGHAVVAGRSQISEDDIRFVIELAIDSSPPTRAKLVGILIENGGELKTSQVETLLQCSKTTALKEMETLKALNVCDISEQGGMIGQPEKIIRLKEDFRWFMSDECKNLRNR
jgi:hypothetical protein